MRFQCGESFDNEEGTFRWYCCGEGDRVMVRAKKQNSIVEALNMTELTSYRYAQIFRNLFNRIQRPLNHQ